MRKFQYYFQTFIRLMVLSASVHIIVLVVYFFTTKDTQALNFFSIVGLNLFFPTIATSRFADLYSVVTIVVLYVLLLVLFHQRGKKM